MQRFTTKHFWRMKESEQGEFVRYEDAKHLLDGYKKAEQYAHDLYRDENNKKWMIKQHCFIRIRVMYLIITVLMGLVVGKLIVWSLGVL